MEGIDDNLENDKIILVKVKNSVLKMRTYKNITFFQCSDKGVDDHFGIGYLPRLVYFEGDHINIKMAVLQNMIQF